MSHGFIPVPNVARVELIYSVNGIIAENVFNVQKGSPYTLAQLQSLRGTVDTWDSTTWKQSRGGGAILVRIRTKALDSASSPTEDYSLPTGRVGTLAGTMLPANVTFCFKLPTGLAGRSFRGRWYLVGMTTSLLTGTTNNVLSVTAVTNLLTWLNALPTALTAAGHTLGVVSYYNSGDWRTTGVFTVSQPFVAVDYNIDSMRKRLTGRGST